MNLGQNFAVWFSVDFGQISVQILCAVVPTRIPVPFSVFSRVQIGQIETPGGRKRRIVGAIVRRKNGIFLALADAFFCSLFRRRKFPSCLALPVESIRKEHRFRAVPAAAASTE